MATLIGLLKGTSLYDPERNPSRCIVRRNLVLNNMCREGFLSLDQLHTASNTELVLASQKEQQPKIAPFFMQHISGKVDEIIAAINDKKKVHINPYTDGLRIYTTIALECNSTQKMP